ncbi:hypothetical protein IFM89_034272 [Coptis chinensis]|uniref:Pentatricopeptide repeat-containing protein n=1 Tax=Coptis chinensis TaxID=261450 RepID=A0A835H6U4_9MAGN|nr:hypothetical protein IFM89_034272 [Coptis chinensis]
MSPGLKHYACVIDLLGRAGLVDKAWDMIKGMPFEPDTNIWRSLLSACKIKGNVKVAEYACNQLMELDYDNTDYHVLLANIYASCGKWNEVSKFLPMVFRDLRATGWFMRLSTQHGNEALIKKDIFVVYYREYKFDRVNWGRPLFLFKRSLCDEALAKQNSGDPLGPHLHGS